MKAFLNACCALGFSGLLLLAARNLDATTIPGDTAGSVTRSTAAVVFNSYTRTKVVQYFDTYRTDPLGLPPGWAARINASEIPASWENSRIAPGIVVQESDRSNLVEAPPELVRVLPAHLRDVRYCLAGSNLVALNNGYKIVDSVQIPTIRLSEDGEHTLPLQLVRQIASRYR